jgi:di/tricarboxylate transporter
MGPGGYRVADFIRAGSPMSLIFIIVMLTMVNVVFGA